MPDKTVTPTFRIEVRDFGHEVCISIGDTPIVTYETWNREPEDQAEELIADALRPFFVAQMEKEGLHPPPDNEMEYGR